MLCMAEEKEAPEEKDLKLSLRPKEKKRYVYRKYRKKQKGKISV